MKRPDFSEIKTGAEFNQWHWLKDELVAICKQANLPYNGGKFELRDRIIYALDNNGSLKANEKKDKPKSYFNWAKSKLTLKTVITDNVSFGPNFRNFMKSEIGNNFSCHSDFMDWVRSNTGKTLQDAVLKWQELENRKDDPNFRRDIAVHNMLNQYVRDFLDDNPDKSFKEALRLWKIKKQMPTKNVITKNKAAKNFSDFVTGFIARNEIRFCNYWQRYGLNPLPLSSLSKLQLLFCLLQVISKTFKNQMLLRVSANKTIDRTFFLHDFCI